MTFSSTIIGHGNLGKWRMKWGSYTNASGDTGGDIDTGLGELLAVFLQPKGSAVINDCHVVDETFPYLAGSAVTTVANDDDDGYWLAFEGTPTLNNTIDEITIFDRAVHRGRVFVLGSITDGGDGAVEMDLSSAISSRVDAVFLQPLDSAVLANMPAVNETFPVPSSGVTLVTTASKSYLFLAEGV